MIKVAGGGDGFAYIGMKFFEDILEGRGKVNVVVNGKTEAIGLAWTVIGILTENDDFDLVKGAGVKGAEDVLGRRKYGGLLVFLFDKTS